MSKRFGRNQKRKLMSQVAELNKRDELRHGVIAEVGRNRREAERQREMMARELADCLERAFKPRMTVHSNHDRHNLGVTATIEDSATVIINSQDISINAMYMLKGENAQEQMALILAKQFVKCLQHGEGTRMRR